MYSSQYMKKCDGKVPVKSLCEMQHWDGTVVTHETHWSGGLVGVALVRILTRMGKCR